MFRAKVGGIERQCRLEGIPLCRFSHIKDIFFFFSLMVWMKKDHYFLNFHLSFSTLSVFVCLPLFLSSLSLLFFAWPGSSSFIPSAELAFSLLLSRVQLSRRVAPSEPPSACIDKCFSPRLDALQKTLLLKTSSCIGRTSSSLKHV